MQLYFCLFFLVPLQLEKAQFQSARIVFIGWWPLQPYLLSRLCFQVFLWTRRMSLSEARLYILSPPRCVLVHTTHQMLWSVICVMFWWEAGVLFTSLYICDLRVVGWGGLLSTVSFSEGMTSEEGWILCEPRFQGQSRKNWSVMEKGKENWRIKETELQWMVRFKFMGFCSHWVEDLTVFIFFLDICCRLAPFMKMIWGESCLVSKGQVRLDPYPQTDKKTPQAWALTIFQGWEGQCNKYRTKDEAFDGFFREGRRCWLCTEKDMLSRSRSCIRDSLNDKNDCFVSAALVVMKAKTQMLTDLPHNLSFFFPDNLILAERHKYTHTHYSFLDQEQITDTVITLWLDWYEGYVNLEHIFLSYFIPIALNAFFFFYLSLQCNWTECVAFFSLFFAQHKAFRAWMRCVHSKFLSIHHC